MIESNKLISNPSSRISYLNPFLSQSTCFSPSTSLLPSPSHTVLFTRPSWASLDRVRAKLKGGTNAATTQDKLVRH